MIIKFSKFEAVIICTLIICLSFVFALKAEKTSTVSSNPKMQTSLPIIMYHHLTENPSKAGKYTVIKSEFEKDLILLKEKGYKAVTVKDLIAYSRGEASLPEKPVMITFDDGFESFYAYACPLLEKYGFKAVVSVIGSVTERYSEIDDHNLNYANLNFNEIIEITKSGVVEVQNHSYNMHTNESGKRKGLSKLKDESTENYCKALSDDLMNCHNTILNNTGTVMTAVAYPYGAFSKETLEIIKSLGYKCTFTCEEKVNTVTFGDKDSIYNLGRFNRPSGVSTEEFFKKIIE